MNYNKHGQSYWISLAINPVFDAKGELIPDPNGTPLTVKVDTDGKFLLDEFNDPMFVNTKKMAKVPEKPIDLSGTQAPASKENSGRLTKVA